MVTRSSVIRRLLQSSIGAASFSPARPKRRVPSVLIEALETRTLLSTITWGNASGGNWNTQGNWIGDAVPGASDTAVINVAGGVTITYTSGTDSVQSITSADPISISGGSLTLTSGASVLSDGLAISGGTLTVTGGSTSFTASGTTTISSGNLTAAAGASGVAQPYYLPGPTSSFGVPTLEATGAGSVLDLSHITSLTGGVVFGAGVNIEALAGGDVKLNALTSITAQVFLKSDGSGSVLNLSDLTSLSTTSDAYTSGLQCTNSGQVIDPVLATVTITAPASLLSGPTMTLDGTGTMSTSQITTFTGGQLNISGGNYNLSSLTNFNASGATISAGATLTLSALTSYQTPVTSEDVVTLEATGSGSTLNMSNATSLGGPNEFDCGTNIEALAGGTVKLPGLTSITGQVFLKSDGSGSLLNLSNLTSLSTSSNAYTSGLQCTNSGEVLDSVLSTITLTAPAASLLSGPTVTLDGTSVISTSQITTFTGGQLNISGGTYNLSSLTHFNASGATISAGATLTLAALTSYQTPTVSENVVTLEATGSGSVLDLSALTSLTGPNVFDAGTNIEALAGGTVKLNALPGITGQIFLESDGSGSVLNLSDLTSLSTTSNAYTSGLQCTNSGQVIDPALTTVTITAPASLLSGPTMTLDGTAVISTSQITTFTGGQLNISAGDPNFSGLTHFNASGATISAGGTLTLSALTSYQTPITSEVVVTMEATGAGSLLDLSHITSLTGPNVFDAGTNIEALAGGTVKLNAVPSITGQVFLESDGSGSVLNLSDLTSLSTTSNAYTSGLQCTNSGEVLDGMLGTITLTAPAASLLSGPTMTLDGTSVISTSQITTFTGGELNISGGDPNFSGLSHFNASGAMVSAGGTLTLSALTSYQTPTVSENVVTLEATGSGSILNLSNLTSLTGPNVFDAGTNIEALAGGTVKLLGLTSITGQIFLESDGSGSILNLSNLSSLSTTSNAYTSGLQCTNSGEVIDPVLATVTITAPASLLSGPTLTLDGTGTISTSQIATITGGQLNITGGTPNFSGLTNFNASGATVSGGTLTLSSLTSYQTPATSEDVVTLEATGAGSTLNLSHVTSLTGPTLFDCGTDVDALAGGYINLSQLVTVDAQAFFEADGTGSILDLSNLIYITTTSDAFTSGFQASNGGEILRIGSAAKLGFGAGITGVMAGSTLASITVNVEYGNGATVPTDSSSVTLTLAGTYSGLSGTLVETAQSGVATFGNLSVLLPGSYTFTAIDGSLTSAVSNTFVITPTAPQAYVIQLYHDLLNRAPDSGGLTYWAGLLNTGSPIQTVASAIANSNESNSNVVSNLYETILGRAADSGGLTYWTDQLDAGASLNSIRNGFLASNEYYANHGGTDADWITAVYQYYLARNPDAGGLSYWEGVLSSAGPSASDINPGRLSAANYIGTSPEYYSDVVINAYEKYLLRTADSGGLSYYSNALYTGTLTVNQFIVDLVTSTEYFTAHGLTVV